MKKVKLLWLKVKSGYYWLSKYTKTNLLTHRLVLVLVLVSVVVAAHALGKHHENKDAYIKAMTVSDINQTLKFSKTNAGFKLYPQKRNKDLTIIPFKLLDTDSQSTNAKDYKVALMPIMRQNLPSNVNSSILFFGSTGEGVIAIKGDMPKEPVALVVRNDSNFTTEDAGEGKMQIAGEDTKVKYNGVGFTINAKAHNVKEDRTITSNMSMSNLYYSAFAKKQIHDLKINFKDSVKKQKALENRESSKIQDIKKANKALDKDENDISYDNSADNGDSSDMVSSTSIDDTINDSDSDNIDIKNKRNSLIDDLTNIKEEIKEQQDRQEGYLITSKEIENFSKTKVFDLLSINSKTELRTNDKIK